MHLNLITTKNLFIYSQLQMEEALLRIGEGNWCWINQGSSKAVVLGFSQKAEEHLTSFPPDLPIIQRFSGGGAVLVDENTLFISWIMSKKDLPFDSPEKIHRWAADFYRKALNIPAFDLKENDYVLNDLKCGGNAQYMQKNRWLHHTSFLWDYNPQDMNLLLFPKKTPSYRKNRSHRDFLTPLKNHFHSQEDFLLTIKNALHSHFEIEDKQYAQIQDLCLLPHRTSTSRTLKQ